MTGKVLAVIPARGGSKRVEGKNLRQIAGRPLLVHTIRHAMNSSMLDVVCVSTDSDAIAAVAEQNGARVVRRPTEIATDTATSESAVLHALNEIESQERTTFGTVVLLQCTSPMREWDDIDNAVRQYLAEEADSLVSACATKHFIWRRKDHGGSPLNYDFAHRPRSQDLEPQFQENGSIYVTRCALLRESECRLGGKIAIYEMGFWSSFELDTEEDFALVDWIMRRHTTAGATPFQPATLQLVVFDFDGVMTDNAALVDQVGQEFVRVNRSDGLGISMLKAAGYQILILSSEKNSVVQARADKLGLDCIHGVLPKGNALKTYLTENEIDPFATVYVGNDVNDLDCFAIVGFTVAVADAHPCVIQAADFVLSSAGGNGAVREVCELILDQENDS